ncbi:MAG TPA: hypothetical protein V6D28_23445 [Leptolyngbyaceae cyanobacterium]
MKSICDRATPTKVICYLIFSSILGSLVVATPQVNLARETNSPPLLTDLPSTSPPPKNPLFDLSIKEKKERLLKIPRNPELLNFIEESLYLSSTIAVLPFQETGKPPSLQTEPSKPAENIFQPQNLPLLPDSEKEYELAPNITIISPSAYGKSWGNLSAGFGFQERTRFTREADGVFGIGIGLGDARKAVGLDIGVTITDLDTAEDGTVSFKLHRQLPNDFAVAVGVLNAIDWGLTDSGRSFYGVVTKRFSLQDTPEKLFSQLYVSVGVGSGQFRFESNIYENVDSVNIFGSVAVRVAEPVSAIVEWSGQDLTVGLSVIPFRNIPLAITPGVTDITGNAGDGSRFILGVGYLISF